MWALVTGASSGIGLCYAQCLARDYRADLILVSNQERELFAAAESLASNYGVEVRQICLDLAQSDSADRLYKFATENKFEIDILVNNAGFFFFDSYIRATEQKIESMLMLHVVTVAKLTRLFGADMCRRGRGYVLNMSSLSAWMSYPAIQTYNSTKAFVYNLTRSLRPEFRLKGVNVMVVTPGAVDTSLYSLSPRTRRLCVILGIMIPPEKLARRALKRLFAGRGRCMPGLINHIARPFCLMLPECIINAIIKKVSEKKWEK